MCDFLKVFFPWFLPILYLWKRVFWDSFCSLPKIAFLGPIFGPFPREVFFWLSFSARIQKVPPPQGYPPFGIFNNGLRKVTWGVIFWGVWGVFELDHPHGVVKWRPAMWFEVKEIRLVAFQGFLAVWRNRIMGEIPPKRFPVSFHGTVICYQDTLLRLSLVRCFADLCRRFYHMCNHSFCSAQKPGDLSSNSALHIK